MPSFGIHVFFNFVSENGGATRVKSHTLRNIRNLILMELQAMKKHLERVQVFPLKRSDLIPLDASIFGRLPDHACH